MNRLRELRVASGKSQSALAADLHIAQNTVSQWENESRSIDSDKLHILADYFDTTTDYLLGRVDSPAPPTLIIPDELKGVRMAFNSDGDDDITQDELDILAGVARMLREKRKKDKKADSQDDET